MYKFFVLAMEYALFISYIYELYSHTRARTHAHTHTNGVLECCSCWNKESDVRLKTMKICIIHSNTIDIYWMHSYAYNYITRRNHVKYTILCKAMFIYFFFFHVVCLLRCEKRLNVLHRFFCSILLCIHTFSLER